ncbi:hypothetical protein DPEC_G00070870 [Dallia pectoralis]|uniref:Uncharacterized protein n=1 Tax=Dallia pectoralis TaxID=75939 RepID=A0ACC2H2G5_DALPE|nr:hypothetical protein DPEC_G00070870 [Dallia pectoralis]
MGCRYTAGRVGSDANRRRQPRGLIGYCNTLAKPHATARTGHKQCHLSSAPSLCGGGSQTFRGPDITGPRSIVPRAWDRASPRGEVATAPQPTIESFPDTIAPPEDPGRLQSPLNDPLLPAPAVVPGMTVGEKRKGDPWANCDAQTRPSPGEDRPAPAEKTTGDTARFLLPQTDPLGPPKSLPNEGDDLRVQTPIVVSRTPSRHQVCPHILSAGYVYR